MKIEEYAAREIFKEHGIPVPKGGVVSSLEELEDLTSTLKFPLVLKAQVPVASRGKKGGIVFAEDRRDALEKARHLFSSSIDGFPVRSILVVEKVDVLKELYIGYVIDRGERKVALLASPYGGMDLEEISREHPDTIIKYLLDPLVGLKDYMARNVAFKLGIKSLSKQFTSIAKALYDIFIKYDCELAEINPLALTNEGLIALDTRMIIDDNAALRQPLLQEEKRKEFAYVDLGGNIGIIGNGAGLTMATMDIVAHFGGKPANFLDIGGGARADKVERALKKLLKNPRIKVVLINILGGITRCDEVARGILTALEEAEKIPAIVVRLKGTHEEEGKKMLAEKGIEVFEDMEEAARKAVELCR